MKFIAKFLMGVVASAATIAQAAPTVDGNIGGAEGWLTMTEAANAQPEMIGGGSAVYSDERNESSSYTWYTAGGAARTFRDNRGDTIILNVASDLNNLYLAIAGPTLPFNRFNDNVLGDLNEADYDNDQGDLFVAIDAAGGAASGFLSQTNGHKSYGIKGVDFDGWTPTHVLGVQFVDNGGGGGGAANLESVGSGATSVLAGEGNGLNNGGFDWNATVAGGRLYDIGGDANFANVAGEFEFVIPWTLLGYAAGSGGPAAGEDIRLMFYSTHNGAKWDGFDSGPGLGNASFHEQIGDTPGDVDHDGVNYLPGASDGVPGGTLPGSNEIVDFSATPGHFDGVDTIQEYFAWTVNVVPEPGTYALFGMGALALGWIRSRRK